MKDILNTLRESGLTFFEAKIFLLLTELGSAPVSVIAGRGGFKRTNLYNVLEKLAQKGLVTEHEKGTIRYFQAIEPDSLIQIQELNKRKIEGNIRDLKEIAPSLDAIKSPLMVKPKVRYFQGKDGIANLLDQILANESFDAFFNPETSYDMYPGVLDDFLNNGNIRKLRIREMVVQSPEAESYLKRIKNPNHQ
jgi:sugar-specific transcriptional regulator TrmB